MERDPADYLDYTDDIDVLVTALRRIKEIANELEPNSIPYEVDKALEAIGLVP